MGTVSATTSQSRLAFELVAEEPSGTLSIDGGTGVITVLDSRLLNYELYPSVTATYRAVNGNVFADASITITLTDVTETVQKRLDDGELPSQIVGSGISVDSLYGKTFEGGAIAVYYTTVGSEGNCLIMHPERIGTGQTQSQANTLAENLVAGGKSDWRLPTETERIAFCPNFTNENKSSFPPFFPPVSFYWTGTNCGGICYRSFTLQVGGCSTGGSPASAMLNVLAVRMYNQPR